MILHILIFDDDLGAVHGHITKALATYVGREVSVPDFKIGDSLTLKIPAMRGHPSVELSFVANSHSTKSGIKVAKQIKDGVFNDNDRLWDAVIVDNNWNAQKKNNRDGCEYILPALLESPHFKQCRPEYLLLTWHFADDAYHSGIEEELAGWRPVAEIRPIAKNDIYQLSHWFGHLISARAAARLGQRESLVEATPNEIIGAAIGVDEVSEPTIGKRHIVEVRANGSFTVNGKPPPDKPGQRIQGKTETCLLFLFYLGKHGVTVKQQKEVADCNSWLAERWSGRAPDKCTKNGLSAAIIFQLSALTSFSECLIFSKDTSHEDARKAWNVFRGLYRCPDTRRGAGGNAPETILQSITVKKFALELTAFSKSAAVHQ